MGASEEEEELEKFSRVCEKDKVGCIRRNMTLEGCGEVNVTYGGMKDTIIVVNFGL